ncbi:MAG TPA: phosphatase PAP2 family protein [Dehalococcoidia bacterium]|nr:phosphatase PAP2 family protein [Dehalococcoidia bacterium]
MHPTRTTVLAAIAIVAFAAAIALALHAATGHLLPFDRPYYDELQHVPGGRFYEPLANFLALGVIEYGVLLAAAVYAWVAGNRLLAASMLLVVAARALNMPMKELIERPRPGPADVLIRNPAPGYGFPSGHASTAMLVFGYAAVVAMLHAPRPLAVAAVALSVAAMLLIGWDRIYDGAHWPSDVLGGYATGASLLAIAIAAPPLAMRLWHRARIRRVGHSPARRLG